MPLAPTVEREEIHTRHITMRAFRRADGLFDIEGRVEDSKPVPFMAPLATVEKPAGEHIHDIWIRLVIDDEFLIRRHAFWCVQRGARDPHEVER